MPIDVFDIILELFPSPGDLYAVVPMPTLIVPALDNEFGDGDAYQIDLNKYIDLRRVTPPYQFYLLSANVESVTTFAREQTRLDGLIPDRDRKIVEPITIDDDGILTYEPTGNFLNNILRLQIGIGDSVSVPQQSVVDLNNAYQEPDREESDGDARFNNLLNRIAEGGGTIYDLNVQSLNNLMLLGEGDSLAKFWQRQGIDSNCALTTLSSILQSIGHDISISELIRIASTEIMVGGEPIVTAEQYTETLYGDDGKIVPIPPIGMQDLYASTLAAMYRNLDRAIIENLPQEWIDYIGSMIQFKTTYLTDQGNPFPRNTSGTILDFTTIEDGVDVSDYLHTDNLDAKITNYENLLDPMALATEVDFRYSANQKLAEFYIKRIEDATEEMNEFLLSQEISNISFQDVSKLSGLIEVQQFLSSNHIIDDDNAIANGISWRLSTYNDDIREKDRLTAITPESIKTEYVGIIDRSIDHVKEIKKWLDADSTIPDNIRFGDPVDGDVIQYRIGEYNPSADAEGWNAINIVLDHFDVPHHTGYAVDPFSMVVSELEENNRIAIYVHAKELWSGNVLESINAEGEFVRSGENHIVWITGLETNENGDVIAIINDSAEILGKRLETGIRVPLKVLLGAWEDSEFAYTATGETAPTRNLQVKAQQLNLIAHQTLGRDEHEVINVLKLEPPQLQQIEDDNPGFLVEVGRLKSNLQSERDRILDEYDIDADEALALAGRLDLE